MSQPNLEQVYYQPDYKPKPASLSDYSYADAVQQQKLENILTQLNPDKLLIEIEYRIRKYRKNPISNEWERVNVNQKEVSMEMVTNIISILSSVLNNNTTFSNYTESEVNKLMMLVIDNMIEDLSANCKLYGIDNDYAERNRICFIVCSTIFSALKRALQGNEANKFWKSVNITGDIENANGQSKAKLSDVLKLW
jgi:hypothetical protein